MRNFIEAKVKCHKQMEDGEYKEVCDSYLVKALSFTEAEARVIEAVQPYISGNFSVSAVTKSNISEIIFDESGDFWYKVKANMITINEKTNSEKLTAIYYLVQAGSFKKAYDNFNQAMKGTVSDYTVSSIVETKILDVIE